MHNEAARALAIRRAHRWRASPPGAPSRCPPERRPHTRKLSEIARAARAPFVAARDAACGVARPRCKLLGETSPTPPVPATVAALAPGFPLKPEPARTAAPARRPRGATPDVRTAGPGANISSTIGRA